jgi:hypothetical protein
MHAADLLVAADDRIELALAGLLGEVDAVLLQRLEGTLGILVVDIADAACLADALDGGQHALAVEADCGEDFLRVRLRLGESEQEVLGRDVTVLEGLRFLLGLGQDLHEGGAGLRGAARDLGESAELGIGDLADAARVDAGLRKDRRGGGGLAALSRGEHRDQEMGWGQLGMPFGGGHRLGGGEGFLGERGESVHAHGGLLRSGGLHRSSSAETGGVRRLATQGVRRRREGSDSRFGAISVQCICRSGRSSRGTTVSEAAGRRADGPGSRSGSAPGGR